MIVVSCSTHQKPNSLNQSSENQSTRSECSYNEQAYYDGNVDYYSSLDSGTGDTLPRIVKSVLEFLYPMQVENKVPIVLIADMPDWPHDIHLDSSMGKKYIDAYSDYLNTKGFKWSNYKISLSRDARIIHEETVDSIFSAPCQKGWDIFMRRYNKSMGYCNVSKIGFSNDSVIAIVSLECSYGELGGGEKVFILKNEYDKWKIIRKSMDWVS